MWFIQLSAVVAGMLVVMYVAQFDNIESLLEALGFGFLVYHSDSQKTFFALTYKSALEWHAATYADSVIFSNFTKEPLAITQRGVK